MTAKDYFRFIVEEIHSTVAATVDENGLPVTCVIDMMDYDEGGLYFLTAKGKNFCKRLRGRQYISVSGMKGSDTMSCTAVTVSGKVTEIGPERLPILLERNPYMYEIYPTEESRRALTVFKICEGRGEWFDLSKKPIERASFIFGNAEETKQGYFIGSGCTGCGKCLAVCPQKCISIKGGQAEIHAENCLHCGNCMEVCPSGSVMKRGQ